jgi:hypothetical protein
MSYYTNEKKRRRENKKVVEDMFSGNYDVKIKRLLRICSQVTTTKTSVEAFHGEVTVNMQTNSLVTSAVIQEHTKMTGINMTYDEIVNTLREGVVKKMPKTDANEKLQKNQTAVRVFDTDLSDWRSFRIDSLLTFNGAAA